MSRFHNPVLGVTVSVADEKDDRYRHWEKVAPDWTPPEPPPVFVPVRRS